MSQHFIAWDCAPKGEVDPWFLYYWLQQRRSYFERMAVGSTVKTLGLAVFRSLTFTYPGIPEQRRIAEILRTWDDAVDAAERERTSLADRYAAALDMVLESVAERAPLGEGSRELTARNQDGSLGRERVMGVTNSRGIVPMREQTVAADIARYQVLPPRAFAYNPMRINVGSIAMSPLPHDVLVSPDYVLFACDESRLIPEYFAHVLETRRWKHAVNAGGSGSVRTRTYYDDLAAIRVPMPPIEQQRVVATAFDSMRAEITFVERRIELLRLQKRGLMQKLLSGEIRVPGTADTP